MDFRKEKMLQNRVTKNWIRTKARNSLELRSLGLITNKIDRKCASNVKLIDKSIGKLDEELQCVLTTSQPARERPDTCDILNDTRWRSGSPDSCPPSRVTSSVRRSWQPHAVPDSDLLHRDGFKCSPSGRASPCRYGVFGDNCSSFPCHPLPARPKTASMRKTKLLSAGSRRCTSAMEFTTPTTNLATPGDRRERLISKLSNETVRRPQKWAVDQTVVRERALYISIADLRLKLRKTKPPDFVVNYGEVNTRRTSHLRPRPVKN